MAAHLIFFALLFRLHLVIAAPTPDTLNCHAVDDGALVRTLYEYPIGTWVENIAIRPNGELLLTLLNTPHLDQLNPFRGNATPVTIHTFPDVLSVLGIAEIAPDVFTVAVGNFSITAGASAGSFGVREVVFKEPTENTVDVHTVADIPAADFLNGMCNLPSMPGNVLVGDIQQGVVYRVDTITGEYTVVVNDTLTAPTNGSVFKYVGVNGIHVKDDILYFTNTNQAIFAKVSIHPNGTAVGEPAIIAHVLNSTLEFDDFAIKDDDAYLVTGSGNSIERIGLDGTPKGRIIAGSLNSTQMAEPTSCAFGRTPEDSHVLYVVTAGGIATPVDGHITVGAQVLAVDTRQWNC